MRAPPEPLAHVDCGIMGARYGLVPKYHSPHWSAE